jgi:hypothetical protein
MIAMTLGKNVENQKNHKLADFNNTTRTEDD